MLLTAFEPYDRWTENASWLALTELTRWYEGTTELTTRLYPVDLAEMSTRLRKDLQENYDFVIQLGQAPGSTAIRLETVGLNVRSDGSALIDDGPAAYHSSLPLDRCCHALSSAGIPSELSHHAGTYLCNAALYLSHHYIESFGLHSKSAFIHFPLSPAQAARDPGRLASMSTPMSAAAIALVIDQLATAKTSHSARAT